MKVSKFIRLAGQIDDLFDSSYGRRLPDVSKFAEVKAVLKNELCASIPEPIRKTELTDAEICLLATVIVHLNPCNDLIRKFCLFWSKDVVEMLRTEHQLNTSAKKGHLKKYVILRRGEWSLNDEAISQFYELLMGGSLE